MSEAITLECPCCGDVGATADDEGMFTDGQSLECGCSGLVSVDSESDAWINACNDFCPKCDAPESSR